MTTVIDESFNQRCTVSDDKYGYEPIAPKRNDCNHDDDDNDPYGYGDAAPDTASSSKSRDDNDDVAKYGYGDDNSASQYGYGDTSDYHHPIGNRSNHSTDNSIDCVDYGYGEDEGELRRRRERPRRRGSVTKYSLEATQEVQRDHQNSLQPEDVSDTPPEEETTMALKENASRTPIKSRKSSEHSNSYMSEDDDLSIDEMSCEGQDAAAGADKKKKKKRFGRFRIGRNRSGMSTESAASVSSHKSKN